MWRLPKAQPSGFFAQPSNAAGGHEAPPMYAYNTSYTQQVTPSYNHNRNRASVPLHNSSAAETATGSSVHNNLYYCTPCQLPLDSQEALDRHTASHVTCTACSFQAAPKVVKGHFQARHGKFAGSGFKSVTVAVPGCPVQRFRICVGNRPEDIAAWIADRKRKFPRQKLKVPATTTTKATWNGLSNLLDGYGSSSSSSEGEENAAEKESTEKEKATTNVGDEKNAAIQKNESASPAAFAPRKRLCRYFARNGTCRNGDACTFLHEAPDPRQQAPARKKAKTDNQRSPSTLLENLLESDKKRESALTLQLLEFIVESNFFDGNKA